MKPSNVDFGKIEGRFLAVIGDGPDLGEEPDFIPEQGMVDFTAAVPYLLDPTADPSPVAIRLTTITGILDPEGYLCTLAPNGTAGARGIWLIATEDPDLSVEGWTWTATYRFEPANGTTTQIPAHSFSVPIGSAQDLVKLARVPATPGYGLPQAEAAVNETITGATVVGDELVMTRRNGEVFTAGNVRGAPGAPGPKGDPGPSGVSNTDQFYQVSQAAGRTVSVWDYLNSRYQLIYGDTGTRDITALFGASITGGNVYLKRSATTVEVEFQAVTLPNGSSISFVDLGAAIPAGFRPPRDKDFVPSHRTSTEQATPGAVRFVTNGQVYVYRYTDGETVRINAFWFTDEPWPTSMPGTAVGTIPYQ